MITAIPDSLNKILSSRCDPTLTLTGFKYDRTRTILILFKPGFHRVTVVKRAMRDSPGLGAKSTAVGGLTTDTHSKQRPPVKGIIKGQNLIFIVRIMINGISSGELQGGFVDLSTGICQKYLVGKCSLTKFISQFQGRLIGQYVTDVPEFIRLIR